MLHYDDLCISWLIHICCPNEVFPDISGGYSLLLYPWQTLRGFTLDIDPSLAMSYFTHGAASLTCP